MGEQLYCICTEGVGGTPEPLYDSATGAPAVYATRAAADDECVSVNAGTDGGYFVVTFSTEASAAKPRTCVSHFHACDCREGKIHVLVAALTTRLRAYADAGVSMPPRVMTWMIQDIDSTWMDMYGYSALAPTAKRVAQAAQAKRVQVTDTGGTPVGAGDEIRFSYGVPLMATTATVVQRGRILYVLVDGGEVSLRVLYRHVGRWWKVKEEPRAKTSARKKRSGMTAKKKKRVRTLNAVARDIFHLADEAIELAQAYAGGDSDTATEMAQRLERLGGEAAHASVRKQTVASKHAA